MASRLLGGPVSQVAYDHNLACTYQSTGSKHTISLILTSLGTNLTGIQRLLNREDNVRLGEQEAYLYRTPARFTKPDRAGTLSLLEGNLLVLIAVRQASDPQPTARQAMAAILPRLRYAPG